MPHALRTRYLARSGGLLGFAELTRRHGLDPEALLQEAGLPVAALNDPELYLSYPRLAQLYQLTAARLRDPTFALRLAERQGLEVVGALGAWLCRQATVGEALLGLQRHLGFHARGITMDSRVEGDEIRLTLSLAFAADTDCTQLLLLSLALVEHGMADLQPAHVRPRGAQLGAALPASVRERCARLFGCAVESGRVWQLRYPLSLLAQPVAPRPGLVGRLQRHWREDWPQPPLSVTRQVARGLAALLPTGEASLAGVAALVGVHPRTLQDWLHREGSGYDEVLRSVRLDLACTHLAHSDISLTQLAQDLGYAELAVFSRTFKRWTGLSPGAWRRLRQAA